MARTRAARDRLAQTGLPVHYVETKGELSACGKQIRLGRTTSDPKGVTCEPCKRAIKK